MEEYLKTKGRIFDIQRYSIHDGNGIRTIVFLKGCVLRCRWCCNPESQHYEIETMMVQGEPKVIGEDTTVAEVMKTVEKDRTYYRRTGGGLTLSGGESLCQPKFARDLLRAAKESGITTAMESMGCAPYSTIEEILPYLDQYLLGGSCYRAQTALSAETLAAELSAAVPDGSFFAFESDAAPYSALDPLSLISASSAAVCTGLGTNPCDARFISALATQIGINPYGDARFVGNDGTTSFTETGLHLRVSAQGRIDLQILQSDDRFQSASADALGRIEAARSLLSRLTGDSYGEARVYLQSYSEDGQSAVCTFGYYLSGVEIAPRGGGIEIRFDGTQITRASVLYRSYTATSTPAALLPAAQAAACLPKGETLRLLYAEGTGGELTAGWETE